MEIFKINIPDSEVKNLLQEYLLSQDVDLVGTESIEELTTLVSHFTDDLSSFQRAKSNKELEEDLRLLSEEVEKVELPKKRVKKEGSRAAYMYSHNNEEHKKRLEPLLSLYDNDQYQLKQVKEGYSIVYKGLNAQFGLFRYNVIRVRENIIGLLEFSTRLSQDDIRRVILDEFKDIELYQYRANSPVWYNSCKLEDLIRICHPDSELIQYTLLKLKTADEKLATNRKRMEDKYDL